jgi:hypothetical protein
MANFFVIFISFSGVSEFVRVLLIELAEGGECLLSVPPVGADVVREVSELEGYEFTVCHDQE